MDVDSLSYTVKDGHPRRLERVSPNSSSFQFIHLGLSFMEAPCESHNWSFQSPRATVSTPPPAIKTGPPTPLSRESFAPTLPFYGFRFCERGSLSLTRDRISVLWPSARNGNRTG
ncbi:hypothetical protein AVEN_93549-1 [Araneus ventricosus]|uniref:Uncharacterized protein n=1 Tax=Araneus ventricosus TaxID=182803 RepID=A0A4Y2ARH4_ARAVE|nr:hypothetical protein AVEN_93549-1 [Araneus ventricosus]